MECIETVTRETSVIIRPKHGILNKTLGSQLPARSTRLLNRSRLQQENIVNNSTESSRSFDSLANRKPSQFGRSSSNCSPDDHLFMLDKSLRNSMIQDVYYCKQQLLALRSLLQNADSMNTNDNTNGNFVSNGGDNGDTLLDDNIEYKERDNGSPSLSDDPNYDLVDLRRQVVYLQSQLDDKDRTIRIQQNLINKLEAEMNRTNSVHTDTIDVDQGIETVNIATQTDRIRPLSMNFDVPNSNTKCQEEILVEDVEEEEKEEEETEAEESTASNSSKSFVANHLSPHSENINTALNLKNDIIIKKTISTVRTTHSGNTKSISVNVKKSNSGYTILPKSDTRQPATRLIPSFRRIPRNIPLPSTAISDSYVKNIVTNANSSSNQPQNDGENCVKIQSSQIKSVKLLNNMNKLKSKVFLTPVKSEEDL